MSQRLHGLCDTCLGSKRKTTTARKSRRDIELESQFSGELGSQVSSAFSIGSHSPTVESPTSCQYKHNIDFRNVLPVNMANVPKSQLIGAPSSLGLDTWMKIRLLGESLVHRIDIGCYLWFCF